MAGYYNTAEWQKARRQALHDHGYRCARCNTTLFNMGRAAHVHHRKALKRAPALRSEPLNLLPLCRECHRREHNEENKPMMTSIDGMPNDPSHPWFGGAVAEPGGISAGSGGPSRNSI